MCPLPACPFEVARQAQLLAARRRRRLRPARPAKPTLDLSAGSASQRRGHAAEQHAAAYLQQRGLRILACNLRCRSGEIDLVALEAGTLVFIEVRARSLSSHGGAAASVNRHKQQRLIRTAQYFLPRLARGYFAGRTPPCRFDVITCEAGQLHWLRHAFEA